MTIEAQHQTLVRVSAMLTRACDEGRGLELSPDEVAILVGELELIERKVRGLTLHVQAMGRQGGLQQGLSG